jgi:predicted small metal-binding protein
MLSAKCLSLVIFILIIVPFSTTVLSQTKDKINHSIIVCPEPNCGFATFAFDSSQIPLTYMNHRMYMHNKETTIEDYKLLKRYLDYSTDIPEIKKTHCPHCDNFIEWSKDIKELILDLNFHSSLVHKMQIKEDETKMLIE